MTEKLKKSPITIMKKGSSIITNDTENDNEMNDINGMNDDGKGIIESLDEIIDSKLKVGNFHHRLLLVCGLVLSSSLPL
jgi:hypothetical protein